jgi:cohesin complex subunit SCC1
LFLGWISGANYGAAPLVNMFYSQLILAKKGPLGQVWLAAHWDKKLTKAAISAADVGQAADSIANPVVPLALRVSGHLLLGVTRIYSRKVNYLFTDCSEALVKIKMAFRPGVVDMPEQHQTANLSSINVSSFGEFDTQIPYDIQYNTFIIERAF